MFDSRAHRIAAALVAVAYVGIQTFQWSVFAALPPAQDAAQALLQGPHPLNIARALSMLLSFFGLTYLFLVCCALAFPRRPSAAVAAFLGFFVFCLLEVMLRSVELFHVYLSLPAQYLAATTDQARAALLGQQALFGAVQRALYFPLGLSWILGSALLCAALGGRRYDWLARLAFGLNALRLVLRQLDVYAFPPSNHDALYDMLYLPLVYATFLPVAAWLLLRPAK
ncbi:hypothetical protein [Luteimonas aquatica]|uniref:hypothetical protein n=1 Tax=Luteimonas aquatica TaxID=450364 RepID=UPI001F5AC67B|nr:hypothetical protein [Luteimonas aquatica]